MTWQNSQYLSRSRACRSQRRSLWGRSPEHSELQASSPQDSSPRGRGCRRGGPARNRLGCPVNPVQARRSHRDPTAFQPRGPHSTARQGPSALPARERPAGPSGRTDNRAGGAGGGGRRGRAAPASFPLQPTARLPAPRVPAAPARPQRRPGAAAQEQLGGKRRGGRGTPVPRRGRRPPPCLPAPPRRGVPGGQSAAAARAERAPRPTPPTPAE